MTFDDAKATPLDERDVTQSRPQPVRQCADCGETVSPQFVRVFDGYFCQACWRLLDDRRNSQPDGFSGEAA